MDRAQEDDLPEFIPCSFDLRLVSEIKNLQGEVVASSVDRVMRDGDLDVWRWDSDFTGLNGTLDEQQWIVIWRPDLGNAYHDFGEKCVKNDGRPSMTPRPYQWLLEKTTSKAVSWFRNLGSYEGVPAYIYHTTFEVKEYKTVMTVNVCFFVLSLSLSLSLFNFFEACVVFHPLLFFLLFFRFMFCVRLVQLFSLMVLLRVMNTCST